MVNTVRGMAEAVVGRTTPDAYNVRAAAEDSSMLTRRMISYLLMWDAVSAALPGIAAELGEPTPRIVVDDAAIVVRILSDYGQTEDSPTIGVTLQIVQLHDRMAAVVAWLDAMAQRHAGSPALQRTVEVEISAATLDRRAVEMAGVLGQTQVVPRTTNDTVQE